MAAVSQKVLAAGLLTLQDLTRPPKKGEASFSGLPYAKQWMARKDIERFISSVCERVVVKEVFGNLSLTMQSSALSASREPLDGAQYLTVGTWTGLRIAGHL